jgi:hypothetical protein
VSSNPRTLTRKSVISYVFSPTAWLGQPVGPVGEEFADKCCARSARRTRRG